MKIMELMQKIKGLSLIIVLFFLQSCSNEKKHFQNLNKEKVVALHNLITITRH
jgi:hypothetical protein